MATPNLQKFPINIDYAATGPIAGYYNGMLMNDYRGSLDRQMRDSDLDYQSALNRYTNDLADNPVKDAQRGLALQEAGIQQELYNNGTRRDVANAEAQTKILKYLSDKSDTQLKNLHNEANTYLAFDQMLDSAGPNKPAAWREMVKMAAANGIKIAPDWSQEAEQQIRAKAKVAIFTSPFIQRQLSHQVEAQDREKLANIQGQWHVKAAEVGARAARDTRLATMEPTQATMLEIQSKKANKEPITAEDIQNLDAAYSLKLKSAPKEIQEMRTSISNSVELMNPKQLAEAKERLGLPKDASKADIVKEALDDYYRKDKAQWMKDFVAGGNLTPEAKAKLEMAEKETPTKPAPKVTPGSSSGVSDQAIQRQRAVLQSELQDETNPTNQANIQAEIKRLPPDKGLLVAGQTYDTSRGPAMWNGTKFIPVETPEMKTAQQPALNFRK